MRGRYVRVLTGSVIALSITGTVSSVALAANPPVRMRFHSLPGFHPPAVAVNHDPDPGAGDIFLTPRLSYQRRVRLQRGLEIFNSAGQLVWFHPVARGTATNLEVQRYEDRPVLTWWQIGDSGGEDVIMDNSYRRLATLHAGPGIWTDSHEFQITPQGTALIDGVRAVKADLTSVHGSANGTADNDTIEEVNIRTGRPVWTWRSLDHIPISDTHTRPWGSRTLDYFHLNSIQQLPDGNLLISARHTWAIYEISKATGKVMWELGGKHSSFRMGRGTAFSWQHDARLRGDTLTLFDDASNGPRQEEPQSSAKVLRLNMSRMTATLQRKYTHTPSLVAVSQGNAEALDDGNIFVGWGSDPEFSEYSPAGRQIFSGTFALGVCSYRAYRFPWTARPSSPPALSVSRSQGAVTLYASWNGATRIDAWRVLGGGSPNSLSWVTRAAKTGFETTIHLRSTQPYFEVQALDRDHQVLGTSAVVR